MRGAPPYYHFGIASDAGIAAVFGQPFVTTQEFV